MALFWCDSISLCCSNVPAAQQWWLDVFGCKSVRVPTDWDDPLPSDVALQLPGMDQPNILLSSRVEVEKAGFDRADQRPILFTNRISKAREHLLSRGVEAGPLQQGGATFFEIRDLEGNTIEICEEP